MKQIILLIVFFTVFAQAETETIDFDSDKWEFIGKTKVEEYQGKKSITLGTDKFSLGSAKLKDVDFKNGIIEYDVNSGETRTFAGIRFRSDGAEIENSEDFYMRYHQSGNPDANQYMPIFNGVAAWQIYYGENYSSPIKYKFDKWMHVKIVVATNLADIYIDDMNKPAYTVELMHDRKEGEIKLWALNLSGPARFANFSYQSIDNPGIIGTPIAKKPATKETIMSWQISNAFDSESLKNTVVLTDKEKSNLKYKTLKSETTGMTNLAILQGVSAGKDTVFAKLIIDSDKAQIKKLEFGFSDTVKVFVNNKLTFEGMDKYRTRDYRFLGTVGFYDATYLDLKKGKNEVIFAVTEDYKDKTGWAIQARFKNMDGVSVK